MSTFTRVSRAVAATIAVAVIAALAACTSSPEASDEASPSPSAEQFEPRPLNVITVESAFLADSRIEQRSDRDVMVYLPPQYFETDEAFPVVYYLPGFDDQTAVGVALPRDLDRAFETTAPMIVVIISGVNTFGGSFFVDSSSSGGWASFVAEDVVAAVDAKFRTIPEAGSRGISGHSMGGFGALDIAMRNPDVFSATFAMAPGLFDETGLEDIAMFSSESRIRAMVNTVDELTQLPESEVVGALNQEPDFFTIAYGLAFAPIDEPPYFAYPFTLDGDALVRDDEVWATWEAGYGAFDAKVAEFSGSLEALAGIGINCGSNDAFTWIPRGCAHLSALLDTAGIDHDYIVDDGDHGRQQPERFIDEMLPFMAEHLTD